MSHDSGKLSLVGDAIIYSSSTYGEWSLAVDDVRLIGEYTNQSGPYADDYFLVFVPQESDTCYLASFYCEDRDEVWARLAKRFVGLRSFGLVNSADFKSSVLWPVESASRQLFDFKPMRRGDRLQDRILDRLFPPFLVDAVLRDEFRK